MTFEEFKTELKNKRNFFYQFPWEVCTYFHWTAGSYTSTFNEYHFCILGDGRIVYTRPLDETPQATWKRNTGNIAISLCCCYNATPDDLGDYPPIKELRPSSPISDIKDLYDEPEGTSIKP